MPQSNIEYAMLLPFLVLGIGIVLSVVLEISTKKGKEILPWFSILIFFLAALFSIYNIHDHKILFSGMIEAGGKSGYFNFLFNFASILVVLSSINYLKKYGTHYGEYYILLQLAVLGMMIMAASRDIIMVFLGLELMSVCFYVLAGINRRKLTANEASMKYFLLGAFATGFIVYGIALIYGTATTTSIDYIITNVSDLSQDILFLVGFALLLIGFSFKIAAVPFHMWVPDVYQGSATSVTGLMSTTGKTAAFSVLIIMLSSVFVFGKTNFFQPYFSAIAVLSMLLGSIVAISQNNLKRMLAYSSIAHAGYMSIGLAASNSESISGIIFYLTAYTFMNLGAFGIISIIEGENDSRTGIDSYAGLNSKSPLLAALMSLFMFALAGIPPMAGFFGKYYVFLGAIEAGYTWLAIVGVLSSVISVYFYIRVVVYIYFKESIEEFEIENDSLGKTAIIISAVFIILLGIIPGTIIELIASVISL